MKKFKIFSALALTSLLTISLFSGCSDKNVGQNGTVYFYNCGDYIDEDLLAKFQDETGIKVEYSTYDTNEIMYQKLKSSPGSYDLVIPSDYMIEKMTKEDMIEELDFNNIPNYKYIDDRYKNLSYDPNNKCSVPYMWGTIGIIYNPDLVTEPVNSWDILWNEKYNNKQIIMFDSMRDTLAIGLKKLGYSINSRNPDEINAATEELVKQKQSISPLYYVDEVKDKMISEEAIMATVWSGDAAYIRSENPKLEYVIPEEGANKWFDGMVVPKSAPNKENAEKLINFLCDPENAKQNVDYIGYSTPNKGAYDMLEDPVKDDKGIYPSKEVLDKCEIFTDLGDSLKLYDDAWMKIKTAK
ncbi:MULTISPECIES: spermidine/putrescine ABC transporter substrate-binding protein [Clostridium]|uniref:Spermidine/putrescine ABC transporter substrate-binding protein n=1 Tax=Clostridium aquiflavi TaxID=3073603 RepID=A0ABU1EKF4_9CLOT|nr:MULTISPECIES: spermidine/putrescine ABC transporter substrate-binding protein [unclassified Clostridium]MDR5588865.1 spermidine/putrescine ABC transporter substrate-binding protein [Clostridium sp. 5N-1]NFG60502.1 spermidine/putrescine ABC transporter substrate-binding protein [Clostridium botulinum]NFQ09855.1 spermidine/putrescine ABC transporter substrate-binding protein [Clostridium botulinum]